MAESIESHLESGAPFANRYKLERLLGSGGMGKVYLASDSMLGGEKIAIKVLSTELGTQDQLIQRFLREVQLTRKVTHPNVVRTFDVGNHEGRLFFTMEFVEGTTLRDRTNGEPLEVNEAVRILTQITSGLAAIHQLDIVHRDLKSSNVIMTPNGVAKITDFGVARPGASELTGSDELLGSATHIAPETWRDGENSPQSDIYALGVIAYELVTGILPFDGRTPHELMFKHLRVAAVPPIEITPTIPRWLNSLILRMLDKDPALRPPSAEAVLAEIDTRIRRSTVEDVRAAGSVDGEMFDQDPIEEENLEPLVEAHGERVRAPTIDLTPAERLKFSIDPAVITSEEAEAEAEQLIKDCTEDEANLTVPGPSWKVAAADVARGLLCSALCAGIALGLVLMTPQPWDWGSREALPRGAAGWISIVTLGLALWAALLALPVGLVIPLGRTGRRRQDIIATAVLTGGATVLVTGYMCITLFSWVYGDKLLQAKPVMLNGVSAAFATLGSIALGAAPGPTLHIAQIGSYLQILTGPFSLTGGLMPPLFTIAAFSVLWAWIVAALGREMLGTWRSALIGVLMGSAPVLLAWASSSFVAPHSFEMGLQVSLVGIGASLSLWVCVALMGSLRRQYHEIEAALIQQDIESRNGSSLSRSFNR